MATKTVSGPVIEAHEEGLKRWGTEWAVEEYWPEKWERMLTGLSEAELTIVAAVALRKRGEIRKERGA